MDIWLLIVLVFICITVGITLSLFLWRKRPPKYYSLFIVGIIWLSIGILYILIYFFKENTKLTTFIGIGIPILAVGMFFLIIGLANRDKWKTQQLESRQLEVMEILDKRYASGEISREEYNQTREDIRKSRE